MVELVTALIFPTAPRGDLLVLTSNRDDFDLIQQLASMEPFVH